MGSTITGNGGYWSLATQPPGGVIVTFADCAARGYLSRFYGAGQTTATAVVVHPGTTVDVIMVRHARALSGAVSDRRGHALADICVFVTDANRLGVLDATTSDRDGTWTVEALMPADYLVGYQDCSDSGYLPRLHRNSRTSASAAIVHVGARIHDTLNNALDAWRSGLAARSTRPLNVLAIGDSITEGYSAPSRAERWVDLVRAGLQGGRGGLGFLPAQQDAAGDSPFPDVWSRSGGQFSASGLGQRSYVLAGPRDQATLNVMADRFWISYISRPGGGRIAITVDGKLACVIDTNSVTVDAGSHWDTGPLGAGPHTVVASAAPDNHGGYRPADLEGVMTFNGDFTRGVRMWEAGHAGYSTANFMADTTWTSALNMIRPDLVIIELGACDQRYMTPQTFADNLRRLIETIRREGPVEPSIVLLSLYRPSSVDARYWGQFSVSQHEVAATVGAAVIDLDRLATAGDKTASTLTVDGTHPNAAGNRFIAEQVLAALRTG